MKRFILILFITALQIINISTIHAVNLFKEGTIWRMEFQDPFFENRYTKSFQHIDNSTIINDTNYLVLEETIEYGERNPYTDVLLRTDGNKVFALNYNRDTEYLMYDFGLNIGDSGTFYYADLDGSGIITEYNCICDNIETFTDENGNELELMHLIGFYSTDKIVPAKVIWCRGIGAISGPIVNIFSTPVQLKEVTCDGITYKMPTFSNVNEIADDNLNNSDSDKIYNLNGTPSNLEESGIKIKNGKKILVK